MKVTQLCLTLRPHAVHGILQARILEWVACPFSRGSSWPRNWTWVSCIAGGFFTNWRRKLQPTPVLLPRKIPWMEKAGGLHIVLGVTKSRTRLSDFTFYQGSPLQRKFGAKRRSWVEGSLRWFFWSVLFVCLFFPVLASFLGFSLSHSLSTTPQGCAVFSFYISFQNG